jgi:adenylosuccinate synthase
VPVSVIVGGQYGSEGKGKVADWRARANDVAVAVRVGGPNSGHTVIEPSGRVHVLRQLPTSAFNASVHCALVAGSYIDLDVLMAEIELTGITAGRLSVDPSAVIITDALRRSENERQLNEAIGSTATGTGAAVEARLGRTRQLLFARDMAELSPFVRATVPLMRRYLERGDRILIEGTQGFGLSVLHTPHYPFATSRDTTAAGFVSECGLSPLDVDEVIVVLRAFPIRVGGNSGPLEEEINWSIVTHESGSAEPIVELTSVTHRVRRVARFTTGIVRAALAANAPTMVVMNHLDYIDASCRNQEWIPQRVERFVEQVEGAINRPIDVLGTGPSVLIQRSRGFEERGRAQGEYGRWLTEVRG